MLVEVVEQFLVVFKLNIPLARLCEAKVVAERDEENRRAEETRLLAVLIKEEERPEGRQEVTSSTPQTGEVSECLIL